MYDIKGEVKDNNVLLSIELTKGTPASQGWIAMYASSATGLKYVNILIPDTYCTATITLMNGWVEEIKFHFLFQNQALGPLNFSLKKCLDLFPLAKSLFLVSIFEIDFSLSLGEDKVNVSVEGNLCVVSYTIDSFDPTMDNVWIGVFYRDEWNQRKWRRFGWVTKREGRLEFKKMIHTGKYEARLFAKKTYEVRMTSNTVDLDGLTP